MSATGSLTTALEVTNAAEKLAVAGRGELNDTTLLLASTLNAYGAGVDQAGKFSDAFFTAIQSGQTTLPELAASLGQVAPIAAAVGLPIGDLTATIATLTKNGLDTSQATTGLKAALSNLIQPSTEAADEAKRLGIQFDVNAVATKGWSGFLADLTQKTGGSSSELSKFFGSVEGLNAVLSLTRDGTHGLADAIALTGGNAGVTESAYKVMVNTIQVATQQMENAIRAAATVIGDNLRQPFIDSEHAVEHLFDAIRNAAQSGAFDSLIKIAQDVLKVLRIPSRRSRRTCRLP